MISFTSCNDGNCARKQGCRLNVMCSLRLEQGVTPRVFMITVLPVKKSPHSGGLKGFAVNRGGESVNQRAVTRNATDAKPISETGYDANWGIHVVENVKYGEHFTSS
jgi:hypothetical protein